MATADPITNPISDPTEPDWFKDIVTDDTPPERVEFLKSFDTQDALIDSAQTAKDANWRDDFARDAEGNIDDKFKSQLERYGSPADAGKAFREQRATISGGTYKTAPGADATEDDIKAYREANNIPAEAAGYLDNLPEGLVVGEADKELMTDFLGSMHTLNAPPEYAHAAIEWYNGFAEDQQDQAAEIDHEHHQETEDTLRQEWGSDYRANINLIGALLDQTFGEENRDVLMNARDEGGRAIMNIPGVLAGLADISRKMNPVAAIAPKTGLSAQETLEDEIKGIEDFMRKDRKAYNKDEKQQARLRELYDIRIKHNAA